MISCNDVIQLVKISEGVFFEVPVVDDECQVVFDLDLFCHRLSLPEGVPHDSDQHIKQNDDHDEWGKHEHVIEVEIVLVTKGIDLLVGHQQAVVNKPNRSSDWVVWDFILVFWAQLLVVPDLVLSKQEKAESKTNDKYHKDQHEVNNIENYFFDGVYHGGDRFNKFQEGEASEIDDDYSNHLKLAIGLEVTHFIVFNLLVNQVD